MREPLDLDQPLADAKPLPAAAGRLSFDGTGAVEEPQIFDYIKRIYKRRWVGAAVFLTVVAFAFFDTSGEVPVYEARVRLMIDTEAPKVIPFSDPSAPAPFASREEFYQTQYRIIQSRSIARKTLDTLKLWDRPEYGGTGGGKATSEPTSARSSLRRMASSAVNTVKGWVGAEDRSPAATVAAVANQQIESDVQARAIDRLLRGLTVQPVKSSRLVDVVYRSTDPATATMLANGVADAYIQQNFEIRFIASKEASDWLTSRLKDQREQVEGSELALQKYREQNAGLSLDERQNVTAQKMADLNAAVTRAKTERIEKETLYNQLKSVQNDRSALDSFPAILGNPFVQQLKANVAQFQREYSQLSEKLGDKHPDLVTAKTALTTAEAKLQAEVGRVVQSVKNEYLAAESQERSLVAALEDQKREALLLNRKSIEYGSLQREAQTGQEMFETLLQRAKEVGLSSELKNTNITVVDKAEVPRSPLPTERGRTMLIALMLGLTLAFGIAFSLEYLDNRLKTPDEIKYYLGVPALGMIPAVGGKRGAHAATPLINTPTDATFAEAIRALRTSVVFSCAGDGARTVVVTSPGPGEGKTLVSCNLAMALAQAGQRVLLIDADMRLPRVHQVYDQPAEPGLSNLIVGGVKASEVVRKGGVDHLWILSAGRVPPNPAELLSSTRFRGFLDTVSSHFDWILIDSPPVLAVTDAMVVANIATGVVLVVGAEQTSRGSAQTALEQLRSAHARVLGAVLNRVNLVQDPYYYSKYYKPEYGKYYAKA
jgi:capsular exopolysaccharide synthesis family protein